MSNSVTVSVTLTLPEAVVATPRGQSQSLCLEAKVWEDDNNNETLHQNQGNHWRGLK